VARVKCHADGNGHEQAGQLHSGGGDVLWHQGAWLLLQSCYTVLAAAGAVTSLNAATCALHAAYFRAGDDNVCLMLCDMLCNMSLCTAAAAAGGGRLVMGALPAPGLI
jgi:hypothetical protein